MTHPKQSNRYPLTFCFGEGQATFLFYSLFFSLCTFFTRKSLIQHQFFFVFLFTVLCQFAAHKRSAPPPSCLKKTLSISSTTTEKILSTASTIQPCQRTTEQTVTPAPWSQKRKAVEDNARDRVGEYAQYFEKYWILPIPELVEAVELKTLSFVISDLRTRRLAVLKKEAFEELLKLRASNRGTFAGEVSPRWTSCCPRRI